jgi:hypothetical protein
MLLSDRLPPGALVTIDARPDADHLHFEVGVEDPRPEAPLSGREVPVKWADSGSSAVLLGS